MICKYCGYNLPDDATYCKRCGEVLSGDRPRTVLREEISTHIVGAILVTLFCCWPLGIPAIVYAAKVNERLIYGDYNAARQASQKAKFWIICSIIGAALIVLIFLFISLFVEPF